MADRDAKTPPPSTMASRLFWFVALWAAGVLALALIAYPIRWVLKP